MRISDWSSDVCSSDLSPAVGRTIVEAVGAGCGLLDLARDDPAVFHARSRRATRQAVRRPRLDREPGLRADPPDLWHACRTIARDPAHDAGTRRTCASEDGIRREEYERGTAAIEPRDHQSTSDTACERDGRRNQD